MSSILGVLSDTLASVSIRAAARTPIIGTLSRSFSGVTVSASAFATPTSGYIFKTLDTLTLSGNVSVRIEASLFRSLFRATVSGNSKAQLIGRLVTTTSANLTGKIRVDVVGQLHVTLDTSILSGLHGDLDYVLQDAGHFGLAISSTLYTYRHPVRLPGEAIEPSPIIEPTSLLSFKERYLSLPVGAASTNYIHNSTLFTPDGSTTAVPTGWIIEADTVGSEPVVIGQEYINLIQYVDIKVNYVASSATDKVYIRLANKSDISSSIGEYWTESVYLSLAFGTLANVDSVLLNFDEFDVHHTNTVSHPSSAIFPNSLPLRYYIADITRTRECAYVWPYIIIKPESAGLISFVLRVGAPQMEHGRVPTEFIPTSGTYKSRGGSTIGGANLLLDIPWSDFDRDNYIRKGTRILTADGGMATIVTDPQFQSKSVPALINSPFTVSTYTGLDIKALYPIDTDPVKLIPNPFKFQTKVLPDYFAEVRENVLNDVCDAIIRLGNLRRWDKLDSEYLDLAKEQLGGFFDTVMFDEEAKRRIILELPQFYTYNTTEKYILFLSYLMSVQFSVTPLWTNDYKNFIKNQNLNSTYYPTNHLQLRYDRTIAPTVDLERLTHLFYDLSPVPFVLDSVVANLIGRFSYTIGIYFKQNNHIKIGANRRQGYVPPVRGPNLGFRAPLNGIPSISYLDSLNYLASQSAITPTVTPTPPTPTPTVPTGIIPYSLSVTLVSISPTSVTLQTIAQGTASISYQVQYKTGLTSPWTSVLGTTNNTITLTKMVPSTAYEIQVTATNDYGSTISDSIHVTTLASASALKKSITFCGLNATGVTDFVQLKTTIPKSNSVIVPIFAHTSTQTSTNVTLDSFEPAWIDAARAAGFHVIVSVDLTVADSSNRQTITPGESLSGVQTFMTNLLNLCVSCAIIAQAHGAVGFICGTEIQPWAGASGNDVGPFSAFHMSEWKSIYDSVKNVFSGWVSYSALPSVLPLADPTGPWSMKYNFWDYICLTLFPGVPDNTYTTASQIQNYWDSHPDTNPNTASALNGLPNFVALRNLYNRSNKKIIITEAGIMPVSGAQVSPGDGSLSPPPFNYGIQNEWWTAFMNEVSVNADILQGVFPFSGQVNGFNSGFIGPDFYGVRNTPSANVINTAYNGLLPTVATLPLPVPLPAPAPVPLPPPVPPVTPPIVSTDLTALNNKTVLPELYGIGMSSDFGDYRSFNDPNWRDIMRARNFSHYRMHLETLFHSIFPTKGSAANWTKVQPLLNNLKSVFPSAVFTVTGGWLPNYFNTGLGSDQTIIADQFRQLAQKFKDSGIKITYWEVFNEPDLAGLDNLGGSISAADCANVSNKVFAALLQVDPTYKFGSSPTASPIVSGYTTAFANANPTAHYFAGHAYGGGTDAGINGSVNYGLSLGNNIANANFTVSSKTWPYSLNEYNIDWSGATPHARTQVGSVFVALVTTLGVKSGKLFSSALWQAGPGDGYNSITYNSNSIMSPNGYFLGYAGNVMPGPMVDTVSNGTNLQVLGTTNGFMVINYDQSQTATGRVTITGLGTSAVTRWQMTGSNQTGGTTTVPVSALSTQSFPPLSITIYSGFTVATTPVPIPPVATPAPTPTPPVPTPVPSGSSNVITVNISETLFPIKKEVWGYGVGWLDKNFTGGGYPDGALVGFQNAVKSLNVPFLRHNWVGGTFDHTFPSRGVVNWNWIDQYLLNARKYFTGTLCITLGKVPAWINMSSSSDRTLYGSLCAQVAQRFKAAGQPCKYWVPFNEMNETDVPTLSALFNAAQTALKAVDPQYMVGGLNDSWLIFERITQFTTTSSPDFLSYHVYPTGNSDGPLNTPTIMDRAVYYGTLPAKARAAAGMDIPILIDEYNINYDFDPPDPRQLTNVGAVWNSLFLSNTVKANCRVEMGALWELYMDSNFGVVRSDFSILPTGYTYTKAAAVMSGMAVSTSVTGQVPHLDVLASSTSSANGFGIQLINYDQTVSYNVNIVIPGSTATTINYYEISSANLHGLSKTITSSALADLKIPAMSVVFLY